MASSEADVDGVAAVVPGHPDAVGDGLARAGVSAGPRPRARTSSRARTGSGHRCAGPFGDLHRGGNFDIAVQGHGDVRARAGRAQNGVPAVTRPVGPPVAQPPGRPAGTDTGNVSAVCPAARWMGTDGRLFGPRRIQLPRERRPGRVGDLRLRRPSKAGRSDSVSGSAGVNDTSCG